MAPRIALAALVLLAAIPAPAAGAPAALELESLCLPQFASCAPPPECAGIVPPGGIALARVRAHGAEPATPLRLEPSGRVFHTDGRGHARIAMEEQGSPQRVTRGEVSLALPLVWTGLVAQIVSPQFLDIREPHVPVAVQVRRATDNVPVEGAVVSLRHGPELISMPPSDAAGMTEMQVVVEAGADGRIELVELSWCGLPFVVAGAPDIWYSPATQPVSAEAPLSIRLMAPIEWARVAPVTVGYRVEGAQGATQVAWRLDGGEPRPPPIQVPEGVHEVLALATDANGRSASASVTVRVDALAPALTAHHAPSRPLRCDELRWSVEDAGSGVDATRTQLLVDGRPFPTNDRDNALRPTLPSGTHEVRLRVFDVAGNVAESNQEVTCDAEPPVATPLWATHEWVTCDAVAWALDDAGSGLVADSIRVASAERELASRLAHGVVHVALGSGTHDLVLTAHDAAGHAGRWSARAACDATPPHVDARWEGVTDGVAVRTPRLVATATDAHSGLAALRARLDGGPWIAPEDLALPEDGQHLVEVEATDKVGLRTLTALAVLVDTRPPTIAVAREVGAAFAAVVTDDGGLVSVELLQGERIVARGAPGANGTYQFTFSARSLEDARLVLRAVDRAGNAAYAGLAYVSVEQPSQPVGDPPAPLSGVRSLVVSASRGAAPTVHVSALASGIDGGRAYLRSATGVEHDLGPLAMDGDRLTLAAPAPEAGEYALRLVLTAESGESLVLEAGNLSVEASTAHKAVAGQRIPHVAPLALLAVVALVATLRRRA